ncbi:MAG: hypothetical protein ACXW4E_03285 [Anaerolineales bacterium]
MVVEQVGTELRFKNPGSLLMVVLGFAFWGVGFLDLLGHKSAEADIFGLYSFPLFLLILVYGSALILWLVLFFNSNILSRVVNGIRFIQNTTWLVLTIFAGLGFSLWFLFEWDRWSGLPGLQFTVFGMTALAVLILLFSNWNDSKHQQWRKVIAYPLVALFILEAIFQVMAWFGVLPGLQTIGGDFVPYERIYYNAEGLRNGNANRYGWYFPDFSMDNKKKRILILGGSYVQGLQVQPEQQVSAVLSEIQNQGKNEIKTQTEVISIGLPGFGPSPYLFGEFLAEIQSEPGAILVDEIIVFFHLGDDFQSPVPSHNAILYTTSGDNEAEVHPESARLRHDLTHYFLRGPLSFQPVETIGSNYLTPLVLKELFRSDGENQTSGSGTGSNEYNFPRLKAFVRDNYALTEPTHAGIQATDVELIPAGNNFMFTAGETAETRKAVIIAENILGEAQEIALADDITLRVVTIPAFPEEFFNSPGNGRWESQMGDYDLLLPEKALIEITNKYNIPILPMGQYMYEDGLSVEEVQALYLLKGPGGFTSQGHQYFAEAIYQCFYSESANASCLK